MANIEHDLSERARTTALTALEVVPFAMLIVDSTAQALAVNGRWMELSDLGRANSLGPGWLSVLEPEARARLRETVLRVGAEGGTGTADLQIGSGARARWVRWWASRHEVDDSSLIAVAAADIDEDYARQANLYHQATHDSLTGLLNRSHFMECTDQALRRGARQQRHVAVVYVDLDDFKRVNDRGGHALGDRVLYAIAARLRHAVRSADMVARIGGDEFAVLCEGLTAGEQADVVARRIAGALTESVELDGQRWPVAASVGLAIDRGEAESSEALVDRADRAMYSVKMTHRPSGVSGAGPLSAPSDRRRSAPLAPGAPGTSEPFPGPARSHGPAGAHAPAGSGVPAGAHAPAGSDVPAGSAPPPAGYPPVRPPRVETPVRPPQADAPSAAAVGYSVLDADEARRALRELVEASSARSLGRSTSGGTATATVAPPTTVAPPAPAPARPDLAQAGSRERLATDVLTLRDSIESIKAMLDRLLGHELADTGVIDIRDER